jgi:hypothetical protein
MRVIADESLVTIDDARKLIAIEGCDLFNIKVSKCGGILRSRAIAALAAAHGINCHIGTHVGETELLGAAGRQLAGAIPNFDAYGGGSPVLFSQLLAAKTDARPPSLPSSQNEGNAALSLKEELTHQSRLLSDTGKPSPSGKINPQNTDHPSDKRGRDTNADRPDKQAFIQSES